MTKFEVGRTYATRSICDYDCIFRYEVVKRTEKTVWLKASDGRVKARRVHDWNGAESVHPQGVYSMCPTLTAADPR